MMDCCHSSLTKHNYQLQKVGTYALTRSTEEHDLANFIEIWAQIHLGTLSKTKQMVNGQQKLGNSQIISALVTHPSRYTSKVNILKKSHII